MYPKPDIPSKFPEQVLRGPDDVTLDIPDVATEPVALHALKLPYFAPTKY